MSKFLKKIPYVIGIVLLAYVLILNIIYTVELTLNEFVLVNINTIANIAIPALIMCLILLLSKTMKKVSHKINDKWFLFLGLIVIYIIVQLLWVDNRFIWPNADQRYTYQIAASMKDGNMEEVIANTNDIYGGNTSMRTYLECYPQQFTLAFVWNVLFHIFNSTNIGIILQFNVFCNAITAISTFLICKELSKKYNINKYLGVILIFTFLPIILLSIFVYGDIPGLAFSMLGTYLIIKYINDKKIRYAVFSALSLSLAYMIRTNILIFVIAILIYLFLDMISKEETKKTIKDIAVKIGVVIGLIIIVFTPEAIVKNYYVNKFNIDKEISFPMNGWICMGMLKGKAEGWYYYELANLRYSSSEPENIKNLYNYLIKERLKDFKGNPKEMSEFYFSKTRSTWAEPSFGGLLYNRNFQYRQEDVDTTFTPGYYFVEHYQKALIFIIFGGSILALIKNRKNLSNEMILLITIFIGGFLFHILWETKSRYVFPYIMVLIPIATIEINAKNIFQKLKRKGEK